MRQLQGEDSATLVRGVDDFNTFAHEPRPMRDLEPEFVALHKAIALRRVNGRAWQSEVLSVNGQDLAAATLGRALGAGGER